LEDHIYTISDHLRIQNQELLRLQSLEISLSNSFVAQSQPSLRTAISQLPPAPQFLPFSNQMQLPNSIQFQNQLFQNQYPTPLPFAPPSNNNNNHHQPSIQNQLFQNQIPNPLPFVPQTTNNNNNNHNNNQTNIQQQQQQLQQQQQQQRQFQFPYQQK